MENAYQRQKQPNVVRRNLLDQAARIAINDGIGAVTIQAVANAAGVTKGGLTHHFPNKNALINTVFQDILEFTQAEIEKSIENDPVEYGAFTRAYVREAFRHRNGNISKLSVLMLSEPLPRKQWYDWLAQQLLKFGENETDLKLQMARFTADGVWISGYESQVETAQWKQLREMLVNMTYLEESQS